MSERIDELFEETIELIKRYGKCLLKDPTCDLEEEWNDISQCMMYICDEAEKQSVIHSVFQDFIDGIEESCETVGDFVDTDVINKYKDEIQEGFDNLQLGENNKVYEEFNKLMLSKITKKHDESDITAVSENVNLVDPITKLPLTDPVKNLICGHVYERATIFQLLLSKKSIKCPIPGCVAACKVKEKDLVPDVALKRHLDQNV